MRPFCVLIEISEPLTVRPRRRPRRRRVGLAAVNAVWAMPERAATMVSKAGRGLTTNCRKVNALLLATLTIPSLLATGTDDKAFVVESRQKKKK